MSHELDGFIVVEVLLVKPSFGLEAGVREVLVGVGGQEAQEVHLDHARRLVRDLRDTAG